MREQIYDQIRRASSIEPGVLNLAIAKGLEAADNNRPPAVARDSVLLTAKEHFGIEYEIGTAQLKKEGEA